LAFRNDSIQHKKLELIDGRLMAAATESENIVSLNQQVSIDSRATRISTLIALAYVPAGVVAVSDLLDSSWRRRELIVGGY
jgi:hypothetical protein